MSKDYKEREKEIKQEMRDFANRLEPHTDAGRLKIKLSIAKQRIAELEEALKEAMEWVSVDDRLPEMYARVLVKNENNKVDVSYRSVYTDGSLKWYLVPHGVTHWRPIDSPKEKELLKTEKE